MVGTVLAVLIFWQLAEEKMPIMRNQQIMHVQLMVSLMSVASF